MHFCCLRFSVHSKQIKVVDLKNKGKQQFSCSTTETEKPTRSSEDSSRGSACAPPFPTSLHPCPPPSPLVFHALGAKSEAGHIPAQLWWPAEPCVVLCCVWVWGPRIAHTPPVIHWPWAAPFMCERPGVRVRRGGAGRWPLPLFSRPSRSWPHICVLMGALWRNKREEFGGRRRAKKKH